MTAGRIRKPFELHVLEGDPSKLGKNELARRAGPGYESLEDFTPPDYFNAAEKQFWTEVCQKFGSVRILSVMDKMSLELLIASYAEWREHREYLDRNGYTIIEGNTTGGEKMKAHPRCALKQKCHQEVVTLLMQFGWTPSSRTRTQALSAQEGDPLDDSLGKRPNV